jgi:hypothetical protein
MRSPLPFQNRVEAGRLLAPKVAAAAPDRGVVVLALPRGGVPVAREIALALDAPLDLLIVRKMGVPSQEELAFGAIALGGQQFIDQSLVGSLQLTPAEIQSVITAQQEELARRPADARVRRQDRGFGRRRDGYWLDHARRDSGRPADASQASGGGRTSRIETRVYFMPIRKGGLRLSGHARPLRMGWEVVPGLFRSSLTPRSATLFC